MAEKVEQDWIGQAGFVISNSIGGIANFYSDEVVPRVDVVLGKFSVFTDFSFSLTAQASDGDLSEKEVVETTWGIIGGLTAEVVTARALSGYGAYVAGPVGFIAGYAIMSYD